jgi:hypothetical protein
MMLIVPTVREAEANDARTCASIHVASWKAAYRGMLPDEYLDALSIEDRLGSWEQMLGNERLEGVSVVVVEDEDGAVSGFAMIGPSGEKGSLGELGAIYVHPLGPPGQRPGPGVL